MQVRNSDRDATLSSHSLHQQPFCPLDHLLQSDKHLNHSSAFFQRLKGLTHDRAEHLATVRSLHRVAGVEEVTRRSPAMIGPFSAVTLHGTIPTTARGTSLWGRASSTRCWLATTPGIRDTL